MADPIVPAPGLPPGPVQQLFQSVPESINPVLQTVRKGSIIAFHYISQQPNYRIHDSYPLVLVSDIFTTSLRGCNLHYMTLPYVKSLIKTMANPTFSYAKIKNDNYIVGSFRTYKRPGISQLKMLDVAFLQKVLTVVRALDIGEIDQIRNQIHQMLTEQQGKQPLATPTEETPVQ